MSSSPSSSSRFGGSGSTASCTSDNRPAILSPRCRQCIYNIPLLHAATTTIMALFLINLLLCQHRERETFIHSYILIHSSRNGSRGRSETLSAAVESGDGAAVPKTNDLPCAVESATDAPLTTLYTRARQTSWLLLAVGCEWGSAVLRYGHWIYMCQPCDQ